MKFKIEYAFAVYAIIAVLTFGYARNHQEELPCPASTSPRVCISDNNFLQGANAVMSGMAWPMYLSYSAFKPPKKD